MNFLLVRNWIGACAAFFLAALAAVIAPAAEAPSDTTGFAAELAQFHVEREQRLKSDNGWLAVAGLYWLVPGENPFGTAPDNLIRLPAGSAPAHAGSFILDGDRVRVRVAQEATVTSNGEPVHELDLMSDRDGKPTLLTLADLRMFVIHRTKGFAIRLRDLNAPTRRAFQGIESYPADPSWRITGRLLPGSPPSALVIPSVIGTVDTLASPGAVEFERAGKRYQLHPVIEDSASGELFFIFKDATTGQETYPGGRFLYADAPSP
ncbi:MAG TPA: DUF1684 domain-containing protein, partial [Candidatus Udaeobacter sp.]|nr:DUF1684 domain-containing protein [Candidatus Udaeobacter sp.]